MVFLFTLPSAVGLIVLGRTMIGAIYQGGKFSAYDTEQTALALSCYAVGLAGYSALKVLNPAFYALHDARTPMIVSLLSIAVNYFTASLLFRHTGLGHAGLALSTAAVATFGGVALFVILRNRVGGIYGRNLIESVWKIVVASAVMGAAVLLSSHCIEGWLGVSRLARLVDLAVSIPLGLLVFYAACRILRVSELELAARALANPMARAGNRLSNLRPMARDRRTSPLRSSPARPAAAIDRPDPCVPRSPSSAGTNPRSPLYRSPDRPLPPRVPRSSLR